MTSPWIQHVKNYQAQHGVSYKEAMQQSRASYQAKSGAGLKQMLRKGKNTVNRVAGDVNKYSQVAQDLTGGKFVLKNAIRKTRNTLNRVAPLVSMVAPEIGVPLTAALRMGGSFRPQGGSFRTHGGSNKRTMSRSNYNMLFPEHHSFRGVTPLSLSQFPEAM